MKICHKCGPKVSGSTYKTGDYEVFEQFFPKGAKPFHKRGDKIVLENLKPNTIIFYFAPGQKAWTDISISLRADAYGSLDNSGVTKSDKTGKATCYVKCPQVYRNPENKEIYSRHFHFIYWGANGWERQLYSQQIFCDVSQEDVKKAIKKGTHILVNALPASEYKKQHIAGSISIPTEEATKELVEERILQVFSNYPLLLDAFMKKKISFTEIPLLLYCYSHECNAAASLKEKLDSLGFYNTWHYSGGIVDWF
jgi:rhodanese-related sulfurtransferase